jgi:hypothetical protein
MAGLILSWVTYRHELNEVEQENIETKALRSRYVPALRAADRHDITPWLIFVRS